MWLVGALGVVVGFEMGGVAVAPLAAGFPAAVWQGGAARRGGLGAVAVRVRVGDGAATEPSPAPSAKPAPRGRRPGSPSS